MKKIHVLLDFILLRFYLCCTQRSTMIQNNNVINPTTALVAQVHTAWQMKVDVVAQLEKELTEQQKKVPQSMKGGPCEASLDPVLKQHNVLPWPKKRTIIEIRGEKNAVLSCDIMLDDARSAQGKSRGQSRMTLPCVDRASSSMISQDRTAFFSPRISGMVLFFGQGSSSAKIPRRCLHRQSRCKSVHPSGCRRAHLRAPPSTRPLVRGQKVSSHNSGWSRRSRTSLYASQWGFVLP